MPKEKKLPKAQGTPTGGVPEAKKEQPLEEVLPSPSPTKLETKEQTSSPLPQGKSATKQFTFYEALEKVADGEKVSKLEWDDLKVYGFLNNNLLSLHKADDKLYNWIVSDGDLAGTDWVIIK